MSLVVQDALQLALSRLPSGTSQPQPSVDASDSHYELFSQRIVGRYDKNKDGELDPDEWKVMLLNPAQADANGDSRVTVGEYARWIKSNRNGR